MLLFIDFNLLTRYKHIGIFGESEGDHSGGTDLEILHRSDQMN